MSVVSIFITVIDAFLIHPRSSRSRRSAAGPRARNHSLFEERGDWCLGENICQKSNTNDQKQEKICNFSNLQIFFILMTGPHRRQERNRN